jgi:hypothetical protein
MSKLPHTPLKESLPPKMVALRASVPKGLQGCAPERVDFRGIFAKSLFVEQNLTTGWVRFSTCCKPRPTGLLVFSTSVVFWFSAPLYLYLSLLKKKERKKEGLSEKTRIHGFEHLPKKESTGFPPIPPLTRGNLGAVFPRSRWVLMGVHAQSTHPRVVLRVGIFGGAV